jgi:hypothetical protein
MTKQTRLIDCGGTVFVYDFESKRNVKDLGFEDDVIKGSITDIKRLLLTNFVDDRLLATFKLRIHLNEYENVENKLNHFIDHLKKSSGYPTIKYLAVSELSTEENESYAYINLITDIEIYELTIALDDVLLVEDEEEYFEGIWGEEVIINVYSPSKLLKVFSSSYHQLSTTI